MLVGGWTSKRRHEATHRICPVGNGMNTVIKIVKRSERETCIPANDVKQGRPKPATMVGTVKAWITESRERRSIEANCPQWLMKAREEIRSAKRQATKIVLTPISDPVGESVG